MLPHTQQHSSAKQRTSEGPGMDSLMVSSKMPISRDENDRNAHNMLDFKLRESYEQGLLASHRATAKNPSYEGS